MTEKTGSNSNTSKHPERRAYPPDNHGRQTPQSRLITATSFKQILFKYCRRQSRTGRTFALAALEIENLSQVGQNLGNGAEKQLTKNAINAILATSRDADRLCEVEPGQFLLILPDTRPGSDKTVLDRVKSAITSRKASYNKQPIKASVSYQSVHSAAMGTDPVSLLNELGYRVQKSTSALEKVSSRVAPSLKIVQPFSGSFAAWLQRYAQLAEKKEFRRDRHAKVYCQQVRDTWSNGKEVIFKIIEPAESLYLKQPDNLESLFRRTRVLKDMEHPGVNACLDYHIKDSQALYLVQKKTEGKSISQLLDKAPPDVATLIDWSLQICNIMIYFQSLVPPVVPLSLKKECLIHSREGHLVITDFEVDYLFAEWYQPHNVTEEEMDAAQQGRPIRAFEPVIVSFARLMQSLLTKSTGNGHPVGTVFDRLTGEKWPENLNTVYKIRSELKKIHEERLREGIGT